MPDKYQSMHKTAGLVVIRQYVALLTAKCKPSKSFRQLLPLPQGSLPHFSKIQNTSHAPRYLIIFCKEQDRYSLISELSYCKIWKPTKKGLRNQENT